MELNHTLGHSNKAVSLQELQVINVFIYLVVIQVVAIFMPIQASHLKLKNPITEPESAVFGSKLFLLKMTFPNVITQFHFKREAMCSL